MTDAADRQAMLAEVRRLAKDVKRSLDTVIETRAAEDDEYATSPLYLDYLREKREEEELERQHTKQRWQDIVRISKRNRGES